MNEVASWLLNEANVAEMLGLADDLADLNYPGHSILADALDDAGKDPNQVIRRGLEEACRVVDTVAWHPWWSRYTGMFYTHLETMKRKVTGLLVDFRDEHDLAGHLVKASSPILAARVKAGLEKRATNVFQAHFDEFRVAVTDTERAMVDHMGDGTPNRVRLELQTVGKAIQSHEVYEAKMHLHSLINTLMNQITYSRNAGRPYTPSENLLAPIGWYTIVTTKWLDPL